MFIDRDSPTVGRRASADRAISCGIRAEVVGASGDMRRAEEGLDSVQHVLELMDDRLVRAGLDVPR
jgi:hypothetical protein